MHRAWPARPHNCRSYIPFHFVQTSAAVESDAAVGRGCNAACSNDETRVYFILKVISIRSRKDLEKSFLLGSAEHHLKVFDVYGTYE